jgi:hypothetical protein
MIMQMHSSNAEIQREREREREEQLNNKKYSLLTTIDT